MWILTVRSADSKPTEYLLKPGPNTLGRRMDNDIIIADEAASRAHARVDFDRETNALTVRDLGSRNGTFINHRHIPADNDFDLAPNDVLRIGTCEILVTYRADADTEQLVPPGFQELSRELLLESFNNHATLLFDLIQQMNTVTDFYRAAKTAARFLQMNLDAEFCQVVSAEDFVRLQELGLPQSAAQAAIDRRGAILLPGAEMDNPQLLMDTTRMLQMQTALCVPVISNQANASSAKIVALIGAYKTSPEARPFSQIDLQLAVAAAQLLALAAERLTMDEALQQENRLRQQLQRFAAPAEVEFLLGAYSNTGSLPPPVEQRCTILFVDIAGSTDLAQELGPTKFVGLLQDFYQDATDIIFQYGGLLVNYLGDGLMAVFGLTGVHNRPEAKAVSAGLELTNLLKSRYQGARHIDIGIGINTGSVVAGYVNIRERMDLALVGDPVHVASGLQALARPNRILIGAETYVEVHRDFTIESLGAMAIKDHSQPVPVFEVLSNHQIESPRTQRV